MKSLTSWADSFPCFYLPAISDSLVIYAFFRSTHLHGSVIRKAFNVVGLADRIMRLQAFADVQFRSLLFWFVAQYRWLVIAFRDNVSLPSVSLKTGRMRCPETSITNQPTLRTNPEQRMFHIEEFL